MPSFILRNLDPDFWTRVQAKAAREGVTVKALILRLLTQWLGAAVVALLTTNCTTPYQPTPLPPSAALPAPGTPTRLELTATAGVGPTGGRATVVVQVRDARSAAVADVAVSLASSAGTLTPAQIVTDSDGRGSAILEAPAGPATVTATIANGPSASALVAVQPAGPPPGGLSLTLTATTAIVGSPTQLTVEMSGGSGIVRGVSWTFGDGSRHDGSSTTISHTYPEATSYQANVVVSDTDGRTASVSNVVIVLAPAPTPTPPNPTPSPTPTPTPPQLFTRTGTGNTVFDLPTYVTRVRIIGTYTGFSSNFIVKIAGSLIVNEIIGTGHASTTSDGTFLTGGGTVEITNSAGVAWSFTEVR